MKDALKRLEEFYGMTNKKKTAIDSPLFPSNEFVKNLLKKKKLAQLGKEIEKQKSVVEEIKTERESWFYTNNEELTDKAFSLYYSLM